MLSIAITANMPAMVNLLLNAGANPMVRDRFGYGSLYHALKNQQWEMVDTLMAHPLFDKREPISLQGDHINDFVLRMYYSMLNQAVSATDDATINHLASVSRICQKLGSKINPDIELDYNTTPLSLAIKNKNKRMINALIQDGANPNGLTKDGETYLNYAILKNNNELFTLLINAGADLHLPDEDGRPPIHYALVKNNPSIFNTIMKTSSIDLNEAMNSLQTTPLNYCVEKGYMEMIEELLKHNVNINGMDADKKTTPLIIAISNENETMLRYLLDHGADPTLLTGKGLPLDYAIKKNQPALANIIEAHLNEQKKTQAMPVTSTAHIAKSLQMKPTITNDVIEKVNVKPSATEKSSLPSPEIAHEPDDQPPSKPQMRR